jgi:hypothetical protein
MHTHRDETRSESGPGLGVGLSLGFNPVQRMSFRAEGRTHWMPEGILNTVSLNAERQ